MKKILSFILLFVLLFPVLARVAQVEAKADTPVTVNVTVKATFDGDNPDVLANQNGVPYGTTITASSAHEGYTFAFWIVNGFVDEELELDHTFVVTTTLDLVAVFHPTGGDYAVLFLDSNGKVIGTPQYVANEAAVPTEDLPTKPGYKLAAAESRWVSVAGSLDPAEIEANSVFVLQYELDTEATFEVSVNGGAPDVYNYNEVATLIAPAAPEGEVFSHWVEGSTVLSYDPTYKFTVLADRELTAVYAETAETPAPLVTISDDTQMRTGHHTYVGQFYLPVGYELVEYGFLIGNDTEVELTLSTGTVAKSNAYAPATNEFVTSFAWNVLLNVRTYAVVRQGETLTTVYSDSNLYDAPEIKLAAVGLAHTIAVTSDDRVFTWGWLYPPSWGVGGFLGNGANARVLSPQEITQYFNFHEGEIVISVSASYAHTHLVTSEGRVFAFGLGGTGRLGTGNTATQLYPVEITSNFTGLETGEKVIEVFPSKEPYNFALTSLGKVFAWGGNTSGRLGDGTTLQRNSPINITEHFDLSVDEYIIKLQAGRAHSLALSNTGRVFTWGSDADGKLGNGSVLTSDVHVPTAIAFNLNEGESIIDISAGDHFSLALTSESRVFSWGNNLDGRLGLNQTFAQLSSADTPSLINFTGLLNEEEMIMSVNAGYIAATVTTSQNRVFGWGSTYGRNLAIGSDSNAKTSPILVGHFVSPNLLDSGEVVVQFILGMEITVILTSNGRIFAVGRGRDTNGVDNGIGDGTTSTRNNPVDLTNFFPPTPQTPE